MVLLPALCSISQLPTVSVAEDFVGLSTQSKYWQEISSLAPNYWEARIFDCSRVGRMTCGRQCGSAPQCHGEKRLGPAERSRVADSGATM